MEKPRYLDIDSIQLDENSSCTPSPSPSPRDKRRKKKKSTPTRLFSFDEAKQHKLDEEKTGKSPAFPGSNPCPIPVRITKSFEYEDAQGCISSPTSPYPLSRSCPSRSALRGGHEGLGLGPRPKLHVKWALDVRDPPISSMSHTLKLDQRKNLKKKNKKKTKANRKAAKDAGSNQPAACPAVENQEDSCASDSEEAHHEEKNDNVSSEALTQLKASGSLTPPPSPFPSLSENQGSASFLDVATQHMLLASNFMKKENIAGALIEYKAAAHVFRLAKADAENEKSEHKSAVEQAARGQILAWIAMATLYSASGQVSKGQKCHKLAIEACESLGVSLSESMNELQTLLAPGNINCSVAASLAAPSPCESSANSRPEII